MNEDETMDHVRQAHDHMLPPCFKKREDVSWSAVHKLVHDLARKRGEAEHDPFWEVQDKS